MNFPSRYHDNAMTNYLDTVAAGLITITSAFLGGKVLPFLGEVATDGAMPQWMKWLLGPLGALICMVIAISWLSKRLDKAEAKADERDKERDSDRKALITVVEQNTLYTREGSELMRSQREFNQHFSGTLDELGKQVAKNSGTLEKIVKPNKE